MNLKKIKRYFSFNFLLYIFGRFKLIRKTYKKFNKFKSIKVKKINNQEQYVDFKDNLINIDKNLNLNGYFAGLKLKKNILKEIIRLSKKAKLKTCLDNKSFKNFNQINRYNKKSLKPYTLLNLKSKKLHKYVNKISKDQNLLKIANNYLGRVNKIDVKIQWSPVCKCDDEWREINGQTVTFHYDVHNLNFVYVFFYITDCDKDSGAHELIKESHNKKSFLKHLIGSAKKDEKSLYKFYNKKKFVTIKGKAGFGFIEDTSCFHRAKIPVNKSRLALQFRYH